MTAPSERRVALPHGKESRILEKGEGEPLIFLGGLVGLPRWPAFLERLAQQRRVVAPALPGQFGSEDFRKLDDIADWITAILDLLDACELERPDVVGASVGATLALEAASLSSERIRRLVAIAPFGIFDAAEPVADIWAQRPDAMHPLVSENADALKAFLASPEGYDQNEWQILQKRCIEASARLLWPTCDTGIAKRLHRIRVETLLIWGAEDRVIPASYAKRFADGIAGPTQLRSVEGAGHVAELDQPDAVADAVLSFLV